MMEFVKSVDWLNKNIDQDAIRVIDCRCDLKNPDAGSEWYKKVISQIVFIFIWKRIFPIQSVIMGDGIHCQP